jgi:predicted glutamine amidotransferase
MFLAGKTPDFWNITMQNLIFLLFMQEELPIRSLLISVLHIRSHFCHNGTVTELQSKEKSDSEQFFALLLSNIEKHSNVREAIKNTVNQTKKYTALDFILANNTFAYILVKYQKDSDYYTMKCIENEDYTIISSEALPNFNEEWKKIANGTLLELNIASRMIDYMSL